jgi:hypothetical protein
MIPRLQLSHLSDFAHPRQAELCELLTVEGRLNEVTEALIALEKSLGSMSKKNSVASHEPYNSMHVRSLYCFAVITYIRCFTSGRRPTLDIAQVANLTPKQISLHERLRVVRNQHLAHAVVWEEEAHVYLRGGSKDQPPNGFHIIQAVLASDGPQEIRSFRTLVAKVKTHIHRRITAIGDEVARSFFGSKARWEKLTKAQ